MTTEETAAFNTIKEMVSAFSRNDIDAFTSYWTYPGSYLFDNNELVVFSNKVMWKTFIQNFRNGLPKDYKENKADEVSIKTVGKGMILVSINWGRYNLQGECVSRFGDVYTVIKPNGSDKWFAAMAVANDPDKFVTLGVSQN